MAFKYKQHYFIPLSNQEVDHQTYLNLPNLLDIWYYKFNEQEPIPEPKKKSYLLIFHRKINKKLNEINEFLF
jgi:hypothetical protein